MSDEPPEPSLRERLEIVIFGVDTPAGRRFDVVLLVVILASVLVVLLESVVALHEGWGRTLFVIEVVFTCAFTIEYGLRLYAARRRARYARSFFGVVDLLSIVPTYLAWLVPGAQSFLVIRVLRLLRLFRVFKVMRMLREAHTLQLALVASLPKIAVFLGTVLSTVVIVGALMHLVEGADHGFTSIPRSMYWAIVTLTTVGYGDIAPKTELGQFLASLVMILGYGIIAVPTGIVSAELVQARRDELLDGCPRCGATHHHTDARYCRICAEPLASAARGRPSTWSHDGALDPETPRSGRSPGG